MKVKFDSLPQPVRERLVALFNNPKDERVVHYQKSIVGDGIFIFWGVIAALVAAASRISP